MTDPPPANPALSASTPAFRPSEESEDVSSSSLWGAIGQSFSGLGAGSSSTAAAAAVSTAHAPRDNNTGGGLDLWNFGGFDVDALTADRDDKKYRGASAESRLTSAFGGLELSNNRNHAPPHGGGGRYEYGRQEEYYGRGRYDARQHQWGGQGGYGYQYGGGGGE